jgi:hypothetical protein
MQLLAMDNPQLRFLMSEAAAQLGCMIHRERLREAEHYAELSSSISIGE